MRSGTTLRLIRDVGPGENEHVVEDEMTALIYALATPQMQRAGQEHLHTTTRRRLLRDCSTCGHYTQLTVEGQLDR